LCRLSILRTISHGATPPAGTTGRRRSRPVSGPPSPGRAGGCTPARSGKAPGGSARREGCAFGGVKDLATVHRPAGVLREGVEDAGEAPRHPLDRRRGEAGRKVDDLEGDGLAAARQHRQRDSRSTAAGRSRGPATARRPGGAALPRSSEACEAIPKSAGPGISTRDPGTGAWSRRSRRVTRVRRLSLSRKRVAKGYFGWRDACRRAAVSADPWETGPVSRDESAHRLRPSSIIRHR